MKAKGSKEVRRIRKEYEIRETNPVRGSISTMPLPQPPRANPSPIYSDGK